MVQLGLILDKERFLQSLSGTNELDIPIRQDKTKPVGLRRSRENSPVRIQRNSFGSDNKPDTMLISSSIKRRSLSDMSLKSSLEIEEIKPDLQQAKVPKLEIRSPVIFSRNSPLRASSPAGHYIEMDNSSQIVRSYSVSNRPESSQGRTSPVVPQVSRRTRSSENLTSVGSSYNFAKFNNNNNSKLKSPFSFSLATPTSSLTSFKFLEAKSKTTVTHANAKRSSRRSLDSADRPFSALPSRNGVNDRRSFQQDPYLGTNC